MGLAARAVGTSTATFAHSCRESIDMRKPPRTPPAVVIETTRIVREAQSFYVSNRSGGNDWNALTIGQRIDALIHDALRSGDELQTLTIHVPDDLRDNVRLNLDGTDELVTALPTED
jgi:hypothetical protein